MNKRYIKSMFAIILSVFALTTSTVCIEKVIADPATVQQAVSVVENGNTIAPLSVVQNPKFYLNKNIVMNAKFDKFSTLGLDYKPALKSSEDYISFLIKRDDTKCDIPLSEMKLFLKRDLAEKYIDLKLNDEIQIQGKVFSDALGDPWIDVTSITILNKAPETEKTK